MPDFPAVSVVMSVFNEAEGLARTLDSLQQQTYSDFETVIVDDASTDQTWRVLNDCGLPRLRIHRNSLNRGQTASLNFAIKLARGPYLARHDAQDFSASTRFEQQIALLEAQTETALVGTQVEWVDRAGSLVRRFGYPTDHDAIMARLKGKNSFAHGSVMMRRDAFEAVGGYREAFRLAQDYDLWLRLGEKFQLANLPDPLYQMRFSAGMASVARNNEQNAYAALARQLATERDMSGAEHTNLETAAATVEAKFGRAWLLTRRIRRAANFISWAERLLWWGEPASRYAWPMWVYAVLMWPFSLRVWKFFARQLLRPGPEAGI